MNVDDWEAQLCTLSWFVVAFDLFVPTLLTESRRLDLVESEGKRESRFFEDNAMVSLSAQSMLDMGERGSSSGRSSILRAGMFFDWRWRVSDLARVLFWSFPMIIANVWIVTAAIPAKIQLGTASVGDLYESGEKLEDKSWRFGTLMETQVSIGEKGKRRKSDISTRATPGEIFGENPNPKIQVAGQSYLTLHNYLPKLYSHTVLVDIFKCFTLWVGPYSINVVTAGSITVKPPLAQLTWLFRWESWEANAVSSVSDLQLTYFRIFVRAFCLLLRSLNKSWITVSNRDYRRPTRISREPSSFVSRSQNPILFYILHP